MMHDAQWGKLRSGPRRRFGGWWWMGGAAVFCLATLGLWYVVFSTDLFRVRTLELKGAEVVPRGELRTALVAELAQRPLRGWFGPDHMFFWLFRGSTAGGLAGVPLIESVTVHADLWERRVEVVAQERQLFGVWCREEGACYGFDAHGVLFGEVPAVEGTLILRVRDENARPLVPGYPALPRPLWMQHFLGTVGALREAQLPITEFVVKPFALHEWWVRLDSNVLIYFSFDFVPENLATILQNFTAKPDFQKLTYLDLRVPNRAYYR